MLLRAIKNNACIRMGIAVFEILVGILLFVVLLVVCSVLVSEYLFKMIIYRQKKSSCQKDIDTCKLVQALSDCKNRQIMA